MTDIVEQLERWAYPNQTSFDGVFMHAAWEIKTLRARIAELEDKLKGRTDDECDRAFRSLQTRMETAETERDRWADDNDFLRARIAELEAALEKIETCAIVPDCEQSAWIWEVAHAALVKDKP